jgi:hypothetical protein
MVFAQKNSKREDGRAKGGKKGGKQEQSGLIGESFCESKSPPTGSEFPFPVDPASIEVPCRPNLILSTGNS